MIRDAEHGDIYHLIDMGQKFHMAADAGDLPSFDEVSFVRTVTWLIDSPTGILLVIDKIGVPGMAGAMIYPAWFNLGFNLAQELFWWVEPASRGHEATELRQSLETRMKELGAYSAIMFSMAGMRDEAMARLYRMAGYRPIEHNFIKRL